MLVLLWITAQIFHLFQAVMQVGSLVLFKLKDFNASKANGPKCGNRQEVKESLRIL